MYSGEKIMIDKELRSAILELNPKAEFVPNKDEYIIGYDIAESKILYKFPVFKGWQEK